MNTYPSILILLSAYNGEAYIIEQIKSILSQIDVSIKILIRDDGSTDNTVDILHKYDDNRIIRIIRGKNIGWKKSFLCLLNEAFLIRDQFDYFAFSDQDDVWLPEKISKAVEALTSMKSEVKLYCSNQFFYQDGLNKGLIRGTQLIAPTNENCLIRNLAVGCTIVFNQELLDLVNKYTPKFNPPHDFWLYQLSTLFGEVFVDNNSYILYRQHDSNQVGAKVRKAEIWKRRIKDIVQPSISHPRELQAKDLLSGYSNLMTEDVRKSVEKVAFYRSSFLTRLKLIIDHKYTTGKKSNDFWLKLRILFGRL